MGKKIRVLFFASAKEHTGTKEINLEIPADANVSNLKNILGQKYVGLIPYLDSIVISINQQFAFDHEIIPDDAEVALCPPVSGGDGNNQKNYLMLSSEEIDLNRIVFTLSTPDTGAVVLFTGVVRGITKAEITQRTDHLFYEAYYPMAEVKLKQIAEEIRNQWPDVIGIWIEQRIGKIDSGAPTVVIACSAAHRDSGVFEAARYGINRLKQIVPVWKKEVGPSGDIWVDGEYIPDKND